MLLNFSGCNEFYISCLIRKGNCFCLLLFKIRKNSFPFFIAQRYNHWKSESESHKLIRHKLKITLNSRSEMLGIFIDIFMLSLWRPFSGSKGSWDSLEGCPSSLMTSRLNSSNKVFFKSKTWNEHNIFFCLFMFSFFFVILFLLFRFNKWKAICWSVGYVIWFHFSKNFSRSEKVKFTRNPEPEAKR